MGVSGLWRNPRKTPLFHLLEALYDTVMGVWEERIEACYGFWRGRWDDVVARHLDCDSWVRILSPS